MSYFIQLLHENAAFVFFLVLGLGYLIGKIKIAGFDFGPVTGVLFVGLIFGHFGFGQETPVQSVGFMIFIYSVGFQAGPRFFSVLRKDGLRYFLLALVVAASGFAVAWSTSTWLGLAPGLSAGVMGGAMTTTPILAAAQEAVRSGAVPLAEGFSADQVITNITTGYAITYLFGLVGLILLIRFIPKATGVDLVAEAAELAGDERPAADDLGNLGQIVTRAFLVTKEKLVGISFGQLLQDAETPLIAGHKIKRGDEFIEIDMETSLQLGDKVALVGYQDRMRQGPELVGPEIVDKDLLDAATETGQVVVTKAKATEKAINRRYVIQHYGCVLSGIKRLGVPVPLEPEVQLQRGDVISATGPKASLERMSQEIGHLERNIDETDLLTFALGIAAGVVIGSLSISVGGIDIGLGSAGGLLTSGLVIGFLRSIYPTFGRMPSAARYVFMEFGLLAFMVGVGLQAGHGIVEALTTAGPALLVAGMATTVIPVLIGYLFGRKVLKLNPALLLGGITGAMTSGACLSIINKEAKSTIPALGYTGAYAFANVLLTIAGSLIMLF